MVAMFFISVDFPEPTPPTITPPARPQLPRALVRSDICVSSRPRSLRSTASSRVLASSASVAMAGRSVTEPPAIRLGASTSTSGTASASLVGALSRAGTGWVSDKYGGARVTANFAGVIVQILLLDVVFSLDSVITAVGMVDEVPVMIAAVVIAVAVMMVSAGTISDFVNRHPTVKMLALSFLLLIGFSLLLEGFDQHIPKGYIYFAMGFSVLVEALNLRTRRARPMELRQRYSEDEPRS